MTVTAAMADAGDAKLYDMVTAMPEQTFWMFTESELPATAVVIAAGDRPLPADKFSGNPIAPTYVDPEDTAARKAHRQARFPVGLLQAAFNIKVEDGQASVETDKRHILNSLTGMPLDSEPPCTHEQYDRINKLLHAHYALGGLPRCVAKGGEALERCLAALRAAPPTDRFVVVAPVDDATVEQLIGLLPPTLQHLELSEASMTKLPESVGKLTALRTLNLINCKKLTALPASVGKLTALRTLDLYACSNLTALPESIGNLGALLTLDLNNCRALNALPKSVGKLGALQTLDLHRCLSLTLLPASVGNLGALRTLNLRDCSSLTLLPESVGNLGVLQTLNLKDCSTLKALPVSIGNLGALLTLDLNNCFMRLTALPESVGNLGVLQTLNLKDCSSLKALPVSIGNLGALLTLDLNNCRELTALPESVGNLGVLQTLNLKCCSKLKALPVSIGNLGKLQTLNLRCCWSLTALPESVGNLGKLQTLKLTGDKCDKKLKTLPASVSQLTQLDEDSRQEVEAMLAGALAAMPFAAARDCTAFVPSTPSARASCAFGGCTRGS